MALDPPQPGQVIEYRYLWWAEHRKGRDEGSKHRPCAVIYAVENEGGKTRIYVLPITHTKPQRSENGVELLPKSKQRLQLDDRPTWVITSELNHFEWPGPDVARKNSGIVSRGFLPEQVTTRLRQMIRTRIQSREITAMNRDFNPRRLLDDLRRNRSPEKSKDRDPDRER